MSTLIDYVIVQAGGRGSRLRHHTWNKPKCLVSVNGKPILYHLFCSYPHAKFVIIGDYAFEQLKRYLTVNEPPVQYKLIQAVGKGTAAGIALAKQEIPPTASVLITWSDLVIDKVPEWPEAENIVIGTTSAFTCRWSINEDNKLQELPSNTKGVAGLFFIPNISKLPDPPAEGEFVKWFSTNISNYLTFECNGLRELGDLTTLEETNDQEGFCRFFNRVEIGTNSVKKTVIDQAFLNVHENEVSWYTEVEKLGFRRIPNIHSTKPLIMERIHGQHAFQIKDLNKREKRAVLADYLDALTTLHDKMNVNCTVAEVENVYITKTRNRVDSIATVIPNFTKESVTINGKKCRNIFAQKHITTLDLMLPHLTPKSFVPIHGDPTFSNTIIDQNLRVWFIDPRGYFSKPGIFGDRLYDFAKVYYSSVGCYDLFNRRKFKLHIDTDTVEVLMEESEFESTAIEIFKSSFKEELPRIEVIHGLIWLALSGYAKDDLDSIIGSYYLGLYWLERGLEKL
jgi:aminoglycoside phosphotransferase